MARLGLLAVALAGAVAIAAAAGVQTQAQYEAAFAASVRPFLADAGTTFVRTLAQRFAATQSGASLSALAPQLTPPHTHIHTHTHHYHCPACH
jgi:hypothetical protein